MEIACGIESCSNVILYCLKACRVLVDDFEDVVGVNVGVKGDII
jgi:hypothetical protein